MIVTETRRKTKEENALTFKELEELLLYFSESLLSQTTEDSVCWDVARNCISKLGFVDCVIYMKDEHSGNLVQVAAHGPKNPKGNLLDSPIEIPPGHGICGTVLLTGVPELIVDTSLDPRYIVDDERRLSEISVPIRYRDKVIGIIDCEHPQRNFFTPQHLKILEAVASVTAIKITSLRSERLALEKEKQILETEKKLARLRIMAFHSQMNPHFVFNALNSIQHFILTDDKKSALSYLSNFGKLVRYNLNLLDKELVDLQEEIKILLVYFRIQKLRYGNQFEHSIEVTPTNRNAKVPGLILQTLFENIIEYGIKENLENYKIDVNINIGEEVIFDIKILHDYKNDKSNYIPEYREGILEWEKFIEAYNQYSGYNINRNQESIYDNNSRIVGSLITIKLPNII